jgi:hypothetical protein
MAGGTTTRPERHVGREIAMKRMLVLVSLGFFLSLGPRIASAQFTPEQIAQRDAQEEFLLTADIVRSPSTKA